MRKAVFGRKLSRERDTRRALFRSLIRNLVLNDKIVTTEAKAKAVQRDVDKLITLAAQKSIASKRRVLAKLGNDREVAEELYNHVLPAVAKRKSGFTRIIKLARRKGDNALTVSLEFVDKLVEKPTKGEKDTKSDKQQVKSE